jgi:hypothetical protein
MATTRIQYVDKTKHGHEHITYLGSDTQRWSRREVVRQIEKDGALFYTFEGGKMAWLEVVSPAYGDKYVRTRADGVLTDNLLHLPPCPAGLRLVA